MICTVKYWGGEGVEECKESDCRGALTHLMVTKIYRHIQYLKVLPPYTIVLVF